MKDYYELLEISKHASPEIIEKAYRTLAKKYHPDVQEPGDVKSAEEKFKEIGEAYEILSDPAKRSDYDIELEEFVHNSQETNNKDVEINRLKDELNNIKNQASPDPSNSETQEVQEVPNDQINDAINKAYNDAYYQMLRDNGYTIRYKKSFKDILKNIVSLILTIVILLIIFFILWCIPPIRRTLMNFYEDPIIHLLLSPIVSLF